MGKGIKLIQKLGLMPPNVLNTRALADEFTCAVRADNEECAGINAVGRGNGYIGLSGTFEKGGIVLVGKGIVFDSGGANIKFRHMEDMKFDMLGCATILGVQLETKNKNVGYIGCIADNYFGEGMLYPSYVITYADGTRVEVVDTDAEGRLVLADGIIEAKKSKPKLIITIATLTGSAAATLGPATAVFSNHPKYAKEFLNSSKELMWQLPIFDVHRKAIKANKRVADIKNCANMAGASTAAAFLEHFIGETPWIHLDIAGAAYKNGMPTGCMLETITAFLKRHK